MSTLSPGLLRYSMVDYARSQRWLPPSVVMLITLSVLYTTGGGATLAGYGVTAALLFPLTAWLTVGALNAEEPEQRWVTSVAAGGVGRVVATRVLAACLWALLLSVLAVVWPLLLDDPGRRAGDFAIGLAAHAICAAGGAALGIVLARPLVDAPGYVALGVGLVFVIELATRVLPPVGPVVVQLTGDDPRNAAALALVAIETAAVSSAVAVIGIWVTRQRG
jgi:hypothetical protein